MKRKKHPLYPEPGAWVLDSCRGMPELDPPEPLPKGKLSTTKVIDAIEYEGLGFCVYHYISSGKIEDERLARLWEEARQSLMAVVKQLDRHRPTKKKKAWRKSVKVIPIKDTEEL